MYQTRLFGLEYSEYRDVEGCGENAAGMIQCTALTLRCWECAAPHRPERDAADAEADRQITQFRFQFSTQFSILISELTEAEFRLWSGCLSRFVLSALGSAVSPFQNTPLQSVTFRSGRSHSARAVLLTFLSAEGQALLP